MFCLGMLATVLLLGTKINIEGNVDLGCMSLKDKNKAAFFSCLLAPKRPSPAEALSQLTVTSPPRCGSLTSLAWECLLSRKRADL